MSCVAVDDDKVDISIGNGFVWMFKSLTTFEDMRQCEAPLSIQPKYNFVRFVSGLEIITGTNCK